MKKILVYVLVCVLSSVFSSYNLQAEKLSIDSLRVEIDSINNILDEASKNYDFETMLKYYDDDVIILPNGEPIIQGIDDFIENEKEAAELGFEILEIETAIIDLFYCDNFINEVGSYKVTLKIPGVPYDIVDEGKYLVIWKIYPDGSLKIKLETWNNNELQR